jgi:hypothetical protein
MLRRMLGRARSSTIFRPVKRAGDWCLTKSSISSGLTVRGSGRPDFRAIRFGRVAKRVSGDG